MTANRRIEKQSNRHLDNGPDQDGKHVRSRAKHWNAKQCEQRTQEHSKGETTRAKTSVHHDSKNLLIVFFFFLQVDS